MLERYAIAILSPITFLWTSFSLVIKYSTSKRVRKELGAIYNKFRHHSKPLLFRVYYRNVAKDTFLTQVTLITIIVGLVLGAFISSINGFSMVEYMVKWVLMALMILVAITIMFTPPSQL